MPAPNVSEPAPTASLPDDLVCVPIANLLSAGGFQARRTPLAVLFDPLGRIAVSARSCAQAF